jgi:hypothetical protein
MLSGEVLVLESRDQQQANDTSDDKMAPAPGDDVTHKSLLDWIVVIFYSDGSLLTVC